jgi:hypothetical protein
VSPASAPTTSSEEAALRLRDVPHDTLQIVFETLAETDEPSNNTSTLRQLEFVNIPGPPTSHLEEPTAHTSSSLSETKDNAQNLDWETNTPSREFV